MKPKAITLALSLFIILLIVVLFLPVQAPAQIPSVDLTWTATGDDSTAGTASSYQLRWSTTRPDTTSTATLDTWWNGATVAAGLPAPKVSGSAETYRLTGPFAGSQTLYFLLKACDEVPNCSPYSNLASILVRDTIPPRRVIDLFAR